MRWTPPGHCCVQTTRAQAVLALGTQIVLLVGPKGVLRSTDGGDTFTRIRGRLLSRSKLFNVDRGGSSVFVYGSMRRAQ